MGPGNLGEIPEHHVIRSKVSGAPESFREGAAGGLLSVSGAPKSSREGAAEGLLKISRDWGGVGGLSGGDSRGLGQGFEFNVFLLWSLACF